MKKILLLLLSAISIGIFTGCEDPELPQNKPHRENNRTITRFFLDPEFCHDHLQWDTLYRIYSQAQMDSIFAGYNFWLPTLDFSKESLYLYRGFFNGDHSDIHVEVTTLNENLYMFSYYFPCTPMLTGGAEYTVAFYTDLGIEPTDSIIVDVNYYE